MILDTTLIEEWTGRFLVFIYSHTPKAQPSAQTRRPTIRMEGPLTGDPRILNETVVRSGIFIFASLAWREGDNVASDAAMAATCQGFSRIIGQGIRGWDGS